MALTTSLPGAESSEVSSGDRAAEALLAQSRNGGALSDKPYVDPARETALDEAFAAVPKPAEGEVEPGTENYGVKQEIEGTPKPKAPAAPVEEVVTPPPAVEKKDTPPPVDDGKRKGLLDDVLDKTKAAPAPDATQKAFDDVKLRSDASPKTQETFNNLKEIAKQQIATVKAESEKIAAEKADLAKQLEEISKQVGKNTPETEAELKVLREFRALHDVASRPEFKEKFDSRIEKNDGEIYSLFTQEGMKPETLSAIKALSPNERADYIEKEILPNLTSGQRRVVEAKILDNVNILGEKSKALDAARGDAEKIIAEQRSAPEKAKAADLDTMAKHLRPFLLQMEFFHPKEIPATATESEKKTLEASNKLALELQGSMRTAILDTTPEGRAEATLAVPLAKYYKGQYTQAVARAEAAETELAEIKKASATGRRLGQSSSPAGTPPPAAKPTEQDGDSALDSLFNAATAARA